MDLLVMIAIVIAVTFKVRKSLETASRLPEWDLVLSKIWLGSLVFFGLSKIPFLTFIADWYGGIIYLIYLTTVYLLRDYRPARLFLLALLPFGAVWLIGSALDFLVLHNSYAGLFTTAKTFAILWLIFFGIYATVQNDKERKLRAKQEEETRIAKARKAELEKMVANRTTELTLEKEKLELALAELKATQAQLIQSEKLASLGELTAGIAHEIQNPLNFVNNFAELSVDLTEELKAEIGKLEIPEKDKEYVGEILGDLAQNQQKINHHGKRASNIVKGMLEHSRASSGEKEPTDLNALADEYFRLAYHGLRAKDKNFNASMKTDFDETIGPVRVIPQDIGRVVLNLITNAFYAVSEKQKQAQSSQELPVFEKTEGPGTYEPTVFVRTKRMGDKVVLSVRDNGNGIPASVLDKIFQPFFTTKPSGQGTGLGLSLAYDIVTKGHGGELKVETKEGEGTEFVVQLPLK